MGRKFEHVDTEGSWAISYADMITLLLSFFVLFFTVDHKRVRAQQLQKSLMVRLENKGVAVPNHPGVVSKINIGSDPGDGIDPAILAKFGAKAHEIGDELIIEFANISFFRLGVVDVNSDGRAALEAFASTFIPFASNYNLAIRAFTDSRPVKSKTGRFQDNLELSALRSVSAMRVLQAAGIPLRSMRLGGLGEFVFPDETNDSRDVASTGAADQLRFARKVVLVVEPKRAEGGRQ